MAEGKKQTQTIRIGAMAIDKSFPSTGSAPVTTTTAVQSTAVQIDDDFYGWLLDQASALQRLRPDSLDWRNLVEELETMGRNEENALESYLVVLLKHLLKCRYQPSKKTSSWEASIENSRERIARLLKRSPSLNSKIDEIFRGAYSLARRKAGAEMRLAKDEWDQHLPSSCEWTLETVLDPLFWPAVPVTRG
ncbi:MAG: DUF29 domain-containing protein [Deltaproteobacteria bacterium]|nr:DUF29 domain-containing protein [Deltaproteobacteria bacterium]